MNNIFLKTEVEERGDLKQPGTTRGKGELSKHYWIAVIQLKLFSLLKPWDPFLLSTKDSCRFAVPHYSIGTCIRADANGTEHCKSWPDSESVIIQLLGCLLLLQFSLMKQHYSPWKAKSLILSDTVERLQGREIRCYTGKRVMMLHVKDTYFSFHPYLHGFSEPEIQFYTQQHWGHEGCPGMGY